MFTGIVEERGSVERVADDGNSRRLVISAPGLGRIGLGGSISVNGVCLTAVERGEDEVTVDIVAETLRRSNLGDLEEQSKVNLELPMPADGRFDGHIVQGHVDGVGTISAIAETSESGVLMTVETPASLLRYMVEKGSITIDGVSLTISDITDQEFTVALIPHTLEVTTLGLRNPGEQVNLEVDVLAKYVERLLKE